MNYCSQCGARVALKVPAGDTLPRFVCETCLVIHYQNPRIVAGCIPEWEDRILLCRRAIEQQYGLWTLPAGFMENGETIEQAALRETREEAEADERAAFGHLLSHLSRRVVEDDLRLPASRRHAQEVERVVARHDEPAVGAGRKPVGRRARKLGDDLGAVAAGGRAGRRI